MKIRKIAGLLDPDFVTKAGWDESKHPRAEDGKFGEGGGGRPRPGAERLSTHAPDFGKPPENLHTDADSTGTLMEHLPKAVKQEVLATAEHLANEFPAARVRVLDTGAIYIHQLSYSHNSEKAEKMAAKIKASVRSFGALKGAKVEAYSMKDSWKVTVVPKHLQD